MHNLVSYNQLAEWKHFEQAVDKCNDELDLINDYFNCLIECDEDQSTCKRVCRNMLDDQTFKERRGLTPSLFLCKISFVSVKKNGQRKAKADCQKP